jgi:hypothetical protein
MIMVPIFGDAVRTGIGSVVFGLTVFTDWLPPTTSRDGTASRLGRGRSGLSSRHNGLHSRCAIAHRACASWRRPGMTGAANETAALPRFGRRRYHRKQRSAISCCGGRPRRVSIARHCRRSCGSISSPPG